MANEVPEPPNEIKTILEKTAEFVGKKGSTFEQKVLEREKNNPKFSFLKASDQYHTYYLNRRNEYEQKFAAANAVAAQPPPPPPPTTSPTTTTATTTSPKDDNVIPLNLLQPPPPPPQQPPPPPTEPEKPIRQITEPVPLLYILDIPQDMTAVDLDTIRLTAQYVAINGEQFAQGLALREVRNTQFDFLKPNHHLHHWYRALVESYVAVVFPARGVKETLASKEFTDKQTIMERSINRFEWNQKEQVAAKKAEEEADQERAIIAAIDWHDFVVVDTIDFTHDDLDRLPAPKSFEELLKLNQYDSWDNRDDADAGETEMDVDMEMDVDNNGSNTNSNNNKSGGSGVEEVKPKLKVIKDYTKSKPVSNVKKITQPCPICGVEVPLDEMQEHMRIELLTRRERTKVDAGASIVVQDDEIAKNLQSFASRRTDIFGDDEVEVGKAVKEEVVPEKAIWDGHVASISRTQNQALQIANERIQAQQQLQQLQQQQQQLQQQMQQHIQNQQQSSQGGGGGQPPPPPPYGMPPYGMPYGMPPMMGMDTSGMHDPSSSSSSSSSLHPNKKQKTEDILIPEDEFLRQNPHPLNLVIESSDAQPFNITLQPNDTILTLKERIKDMVGMPPNKQKLKSPGQSILKDQHSLAFYNLYQGTVITVGAKERGGRKK